MVKFTGNPNLQNVQINESITGDVTMNVGLQCDDVRNLLVHVQEIAKNSDFQDRELSELLETTPSEENQEGIKQRLIEYYKKLKAIDEAGELAIKYGAGATTFLSGLIALLG